MNHDIHIIPAFGRQHVESLQCWCLPTRDGLEPSVVIHNLEN